ncbi:MAG: LysR family transcriptional regulator [Nocardioidaceae bacterium]|nr:LysR family transcriptional regulator [Nocardioidaceae bacterium]
MLDLRRLQALVAVHRTGSVSAAAASLHYGQPTVSHHLRRLEVETGSVLLQRVGRGVRLTTAGVRLAQRGEELLGLLSRAEAELSAATSLNAGRVRLAAFPSGAATLVPDALTRLSRHHPNIELDLTEAEPPEAYELLRDGSIDLALTFGYPNQPEPDQITSTAILNDPLHLITAAGTAGSSGDLAAFTDSSWVTGCERCRRELLALCAEAGFVPTIAYASDDYVAVQSLVAAGLGVTVLPGLAVRAHQHAGVERWPLAAHRRVQLSSYGAPPRPAAVEVVAAALSAAARSVAPE